MIEDPRAYADAPPTRGGAQRLSTATTGLSGVVTINTCAQQTDEINVALVDALERARNLVDRIGGFLPPQPAETSGKALVPGNGPVDYIYENQQCALRRIVELMDLLAAVGTRI